jgi:pimeloyl-ACP methyl ester carboxylesterase
MHIAAKIGIGTGTLLLALVASQLKADLPLDQLKARWATGASRFIDVDGMSVHYRDEGSGPSVVLIHGTGASLHTWDAWASALSGSHRVVRFDLPGFGLTGPQPSGDYRMETYVAFVDHVVARLGVGKFTLAGNSLGGNIAWRFAAAHPDELTALVLVDAGGYPRTGTPPIVFRLGRMPVVSSLMAHLDPHVLVDKTVRGVYGDPSLATPEIIERYYELSLREGNRAAFGARTSVPYEDHTAELRGLKVPTVIMWGSKDSLIPVAHAQLFARDIQGAKVLVYDGLGHVPMEEAGPRTAADVTAFLATTVADAR